MDTIRPMTHEERQRSKERAMANKAVTDYWEDDCPADIAKEIHKWLKERSDEEDRG